MIAALLMAFVLSGALTAGTFAAGTENKLPYSIMVNRKMNTVTVYTLDENGAYTVPYKAMICSTGRLGHATPLGTYSVTNVKKEWCLMFDGTYGQYSTQFFGNYLFHSICYTEPDPSTMLAQEYNMLGSVASLGCVRLQTADAKWIYENCAAGTRVSIYDSDDPGPLGKPERMVDVVPDDYGWDPTDPRAENPWTQISVEEIRLSAETAELTAGNALTLTAECLPENAGIRTVVWSSDALKVASVQNGRVVALREGTAVITASCGKASSSCAVTVKGTLLPFTDLTPGAWYYDDIRLASERKFLNGTGDGRMMPDNAVTWPEAIQIVYNLAGRTQAKSSMESWYGTALAWAEQNGLLEELTFDAAKPVTRAEMIMLLYRCAQKTGRRSATTGSLAEFADAEVVPTFAVDAVSWAVGSEILKGDETGRIDPLAHLTRAQAASLIRRYSKEPA